jgi:hypothetical protein
MVFTMVRAWGMFRPGRTKEGYNFVGSLLKPLLKKVTPIVDSRMLCLLLPQIPTLKQSPILLLRWILWLSVPGQ